MSTKPVLTVLASAVLFGISTPIVKLLLKDVSPLAMAGLLYLGVFAGLVAYPTAVKAAGLGAATSREAAIGRADIPWLAGAVAAGGVAGPVCLMTGLSRISGFSASLLLNFEGVATALIAALVFRENAGRRVWSALALMTAAGMLLSVNPAGGRLSPAGPLLVALAMGFWGLDNNLTRHISAKNPVEIARIKGLAAGAVSTSAAFLLGRGPHTGWPALYALSVGAVCYGLSLVLFVRALRDLGAFRTAALFSAAPFVGSLASLVLLGDRPGWAMAAASVLMLAGVVFVTGERHDHVHRHAPTVHAHAHRHGDLHHDHAHEGAFEEPHAHLHEHPELEHNHGHWPDIHHRHGHDGLKK